jgi:hypothetical protein
MPLSLILFQPGLSVGTVSRVKFWLYNFIHNITPCVNDYIKRRSKIANFFSGREKNGGTNYPDSKDSAQYKRQAGKIDSHFPAAFFLPTA